MTSDNSTIYVKDVMPRKLQKLALDRDRKKEIRKEEHRIQLFKDLRDNKEKLEEMRRSLCARLNIFVEQNNEVAIANYGNDFLQLLMDDTIVREKEASVAVMGKQQYVDMVQAAMEKEEEEESASYIQKARLKRELAIRRLGDVVQERESVFASIEILAYYLNQRKGKDHAAQFSSPVINYLIMKNRIEEGTLAVKKCK